MKRFLVYLFGTFFFSGRSPLASGTAGSFAALLFLALGARALPPSFYPLVQALLILAFACAGIPAASYIERMEGQKDPGCVVIDEVVGQWISFLFIPSALINSHFWILPAGFLFFRFIDIIKPFPARQAERIPGGLGVMLDDIIAGLYACVILNLTVKWAER
jgi:phosphatidylglycerophosphatase A